MSDTPTNKPDIGKGKKPRDKSLTPENKCEKEHCRQFKLTGSRFCTYHSHIRGKAGNPRPSVFGKLVAPKGLESVIPKDRMSYYVKRVGPKLRKLLEDGIAQYKAGDITEELVLAREINAQSIALFDVLLETEGLDPVAKQHALINAGELVTRGIEQYTHLVERQAKISALIGNKLMPDAIEKVTEQITRFVYECFDKDQEAVAEFDRKMSEELELPVLANSANVGTRFTPDMLAAAMDATIPFCEETDATDQTETASS